MVAVTGFGMWPGTDVREAQAVVVGDLTSVPDGLDGMPFTVSLPARGPWADPVGVGASLLLDLPVELGIHGWMLSDRPGRDLSRAHALAREDLDALAVAAYGYSGALVVPIIGPISLAAQLYLARGDRVLADPGALRELAESLGAGINAHVERIRGAVPGAQVTVLLRERLLAQAMAGVVPSFSGRASLRSIPAPVAAERLRTVLAGVRTVEGVHGVVDVGPSWTTIGTVVSAGVEGVGVAVAGIERRGWERIAETVEQGVPLWAGLPEAAARRSDRPELSAVSEAAGLARALVDPWHAVGLPARGLADVVLLPEVPAEAGGGWGAPEEARGALALVIEAAQTVAERAAG